MNCFTLFNQYRLIQQEIEAGYGIIIEVYNFAIENIQKRFPITEDHVIATILDPCFKKLKLIDDYIPLPDNKASILEAKIKQHGFDTNHESSASADVVSCVFFFYFILSSDF